MLRRVVRVLRRLLLVVGLLLVASIPVSFLYGASFDVGRDDGVTRVYVQSGHLCYFTIDGDGQPVFGLEPEFVFAKVAPRKRSYSKALLPRYGGIYGVSGVTEARAPLWLLAFLCLAWPVTSFIIHRRRHKRGFPVVGPEVSGQKSEVSQSLVESATKSPSDR